MRRTKIICTIGPATREPTTLARLVHEGMDVARLNMAHGSLEDHAENVTRIRAAARSEGKPVAIQVDLQGPKLRVGAVRDPGIELTEGERATLTTHEIVGEDTCAVPVQNDVFPDLVSPGDRILIDDGRIEAQVVDVRTSEVDVLVLVGGTLRSNKGINLPGVTTDLPALTDKDLRDLGAALRWGVDWIALSFARTAAGVQELSRRIAERADYAVRVMAKIEKPQALRNLDEIICTTDAVMIARGDLGLEIRPEEVPMAQKRIISACNDAGVPVVTATQMLNSMIHAPRPTRAEASDVANAILDGSDALMLSGETSIGSYPVEAVRTLVRVAREVEGALGHVSERPYRPVGDSRPRTVASAVGHSARNVAHHLNATAIITPTISGYTATVMARYRPSCPVVAVTPDPQVQRRLMLYWGITPLLAPRAESTDTMIDRAVDAARQKGLVQARDTVVVTGGSARSGPGSTDLLRVYIVEG